MIQKFKNELFTDIMSYKILFIFCFMVHFMLVLIFSYYDIVPLAIYNIGSVIFYMIGFFKICQKKKAGFWLVGAFVEIVVHVVLCNQLIGWGYGFSMYGALVVPITFYNSYMNEADEKAEKGFSLWIAVMFSLVACVSIVLSMTGMKEDYLFTMPEEGPKRYLFFINCLITMLAITMYTLLFYMRVQNSKEVMKQQKEQLIYMANHDKLTNLRNRTSSVEIFKKIEDSRSQYCIAIGDIDDFKKVNDTYGHNIGDEVLIKVSDVIKKSVPGVGNTFRWGGEEFLVLLPVPKEEMVRQIEQIRRQIEQLEFASGLTQFRVTMTFGVAESHALMNCNQVLSAADRRLYVGKRSGKNQVVSQ